jgi:hypothetical protein
MLPADLKCIGGYPDMPDISGVSQLTALFVDDDISENSDVLMT